MPILAT